MTKSLKRVIRDAYEGQPLSEGQKQYLQQIAPMRKGRPEGPSFSECWKAYKDTPEYRELAEEIRNRRFVIEHLIWRAYSAGFRAKNGRKAEKEEEL